MLALTLAPSAAGAQCVISPSSNEAKLLAFYSAPILFGLPIAPRVDRPGTVRLGGEMVPIPSPSADITTTSSCFVAKSEHTRLAPVFGRPRLSVALPYGFSVEGSYLPPVRVGKVTPNLGSAALAWVAPLRPRPIGGPLALVLRAHGTRGTVKGPITCDKSVLQQDDVNQPCFGTHKSHDTYHPDMTGVEGALSAWTASGRVGVVLGSGYTWLRPRFVVGFTDSRGTVDTTHVGVNLERWNGFGGVTVRALERLDVAAQLHVAAGDVATLHLAGAWRLH